MTPSRRRRETTREEAVNGALERVLRLHGLNAKAERRSKEGAPDARIELRSGDLVLLECKWKSSAGSLDEQIAGRLQQFPEALGIFGVLYPERLHGEDDIQASLLAAGDLRWRLYGSRGQPVTGSPLRSGSVADLADQLRVLPLELEGADRVDAATQVVDYAIEKAVEPIRQHRRISRRIADIIAEADKESDRIAALRIGCLVLFNALAFQDRLAGAEEARRRHEDAGGRDAPALHKAMVEQAIHGYDVQLSAIQNDAIVRF